ncbi:hypothetical protein CRUP_026162 [Coryphaenoides rupestris]|nr:hypothetical protein CRUP_026162 [Coryphaenoides rupestris]
MEGGRPHVVDRDPCKGKGTNCIQAEAPCWCPSQRDSHTWCREDLELAVGWSSSTSNSTSNQKTHKTAAYWSWSGDTTTTTISKTISTTTTTTTRTTTRTIISQV